MNVSLTPSLEQYIRHRAATGDYNNASEVVREAIRLLKEKDEQRQLKLKQLREAIQLGIDDMENGNSIEINSDEKLDAFFAKL